MFVYLIFQLIESVKKLHLIKNEWFFPLVVSLNIFFLIALFIYYSKMNKS